MMPQDDVTVKSAEKVKNFLKESRRFDKFYPFNYNKLSFNNTIFFVGIKGFGIFIKKKEPQKRLFYSRILILSFNDVLSRFAHNFFIHCGIRRSFRAEQQNDAVFIKF